MNEKLFQFIWQNRHFNLRNLATTTGQKIEIIKSGILNLHQGPDFLNGKLKIGETLWAGSIELHLKSSDWQKHNHSKDPNYDNVILHVVFENDKDLKLNIPTLELKGRISANLLGRYSEFMQSTLFIPCQSQIINTDPLVFSSWKERMLVERLEQKVSQILILLESNKYHWEEVFWWMLAANFGMKVNSSSFEKIARTIPLKILTKHKFQLIELEALLLGQAGLLDTYFEDSYAILLKREYKFLKKKYNLEKVHYPLYFLRMRPANFPTIRLAQLAALINRSNHLFSLIKNEKDLNIIMSYFNVEANDYWHYHYHLGEETSFKRKFIGKEKVRNIMINTIIPILFTYAKVNKIESIKEQTLNWLSKIAAEKNKVTTGFQNIGVENLNAFDSQALLHLKKEYCNYKRCLECSIGSNILKLSGSPVV